MRPMTSLVLAAAVAGLATAPAQAAVTLFSDAAAFAAALQSSALEDFTDTDLQPGVSLDCTNCSVDLGGGRLVDQALTGIGQRTRIKFDAPITAWGANIDETPSGFGRGLFISYRLTDGFTTLTIQPQLDGYAGEFFGFISDEAFTFVGISPGVNPAFTSERYALDNMRYGVARVGAAPDAGGGVPEPAAWALMIGGLGLSGAMLRRRRTLPLRSLRPS